MIFDPARVWLYHELLTAVPEEMGQALERSAYSPNIKERRDYSCALFDARGRMLAQAAHIPVHLGAMPMLMRFLLHSQPWQPGDMILTNDPYSAGTHLPDWTLVAPIFWDHELAGFVANRAHHADTGGSTPGSMPLAREIYEEGLRMPPIPLMKAGKIDTALWNLILANTRAPDERQGDLYAQIGANQVGIARLTALYQRNGRAEWEQRFDQLLSYSARQTRLCLQALAPGDYSFEDRLDDDGRGTKDVLIRVCATVKTNGDLRFDFTGSAPQTPGGINATEAVTKAACFYVARCLCDTDLPTNEGCWEPVEVIAPPGTVVNATAPSAVAGGNVETSQRITDTLLGALAKAAPDKIPAASQGTMNNVLLGGYDPFRQRPFAYYETLAGGAGASASQDGASGVHTHMTNTRNTPIEALETAYPLRVLEYRIADKTGGAGLHQGGCGIFRVYQILCDSTLTLFTDRRRRAPYGLQGGQPGKRGANYLKLGENLEAELNKGTLRCPPNSFLSIRSPGGGGWGKKQARKNIGKTAEK